MKLSRVWTFLLLASVTLPLHAKRVICIDQPGDSLNGFIHNAEGYERVRAKMDGVVIFPVWGGLLKDCLANVANNDELVIIAHGMTIHDDNKKLVRTEFLFNGRSYRGFGDGLFLAPVPPGFAALKGVKVRFFACYSALDVDGAGPHVSLLNQLIRAMGGKANHPLGSGFAGQADPDVIPYLRPAIAADLDAAEAKLKDSSWVEKPPVNRPEAAADNQRTAAQKLVSNTGVTVEIADAIYDDSVAESSGYRLEAQTTSSEEKIAKEGDCECEECVGRGLTRPVCLLHALHAGPPIVLEVLTEDVAEGLCAIEVLHATNASVDIPSFAPGEPGPVIVTATKTDQTQSSTIQLRVENCEGLTTVCDPVLSLVVREAGNPVRHSFSGIPQAESTIEVHNGTPGLRNVKVTVNGVPFRAALRDGEVWTLDAASAMLPGETNIVTIEGRGKPGGSALVVVHD
jgi:hypothetical protein